MHDTWNDGEAYERFIGRWSRRVAPLFLDWLALPRGLRWVDVGCGTGALSSAILERCAPAGVLGVDPSPGFVAAAAGTIRDPRARFETGAATDLAAESCDVAVAGLVLNFVPDPGDAVRAMAAACPGGTVAAYVWDYSGGMQLLRRFWDVVTELDSSAAPLDEATRFPLCRPGGLAELWTRAGLVGVEDAAVEVETPFADFDDYWEPFLGGQGPAPTYLVDLDEGRRVEVREALRARLAPAPGQPLALTARAWAVRGRSG